MPHWVRQSREARQAGTRARLIECAHDVFLRHGFHAATLEAIALQAGVTKGAVYSNFESKAELFLAVNGTRMEARLQHYRKIRATITRLETFLREFTRVMIRDDPDGRWASVVAEAWAVAAGDELFRTAVIEQSARANAVVTDTIEGLARRAGVRFRLPSAKMSRIGSALMRGLLLQRLLDPRAVPREFMEEAFVTFIQSMALPQSPRRQRRDHDEHAVWSPAPRVDGSLAVSRPGRRATARRGA
jgi:AcrR family transcriptional regulator